MTRLVPMESTEKEYTEDQQSDYKQQRKAKSQSDPAFALLFGHGRSTSFMKRFRGIFTELDLHSSSPVVIHVPDPGFLEHGKGRYEHGKPVAEPIC